MNIVFTTWNKKNKKLLKEVQKEVHLADFFVYEDDKALSDSEVFEDFSDKLARCVRTDTNFYVESTREVFLLAIRGIVKQSKGKINGYVYYINDSGVIDYSIMGNAGELRPYPIGMFELREKLLMRLLW